MQRSRRSLGRLFAKAISRLLHVQSEIHGMAERARRRRHDHSVAAAWRARISTTAAPPAAAAKPCHNEGCHERRQGTPPSLSRNAAEKHCCDSETSACCPPTGSV